MLKQTIKHNCFTFPPASVSCFSTCASQDSPACTAGKIHPTRLLPRHTTVSRWKPEGTFRDLVDFETLVAVAVHRNAKVLPFSFSDPRHHTHQRSILMLLSKFSTLCAVCSSLCLRIEIEESADSLPSKTFSNKRNRERNQHEIRCTEC